MTEIEIWTDEDQALLTEKLAEATEIMRTLNRLADQLLNNSAPDKAQRDRDSIAFHARGMIVAKILRPLADKALRVHEAKEAAAKKAEAEA